MKARHLIMTLAMLATLVLGYSPASAQGVHLFAILNGGNEVSAGGAANQGDPDGHGAATVVIVNNRRICFAIVVVGIDTPTAAHIHPGKAGSTGGILIGLGAPKKGDPGTVSGCVRADAADIKAIQATPSEFYVNVHTGQFPGGALRGQLL